MADKKIKNIFDKASGGSVTKVLKSISKDTGSNSKASKSKANTGSKNAGTIVSKIKNTAPKTWAEAAGKSGGSTSAIRSLADKASGGAVTRTVKAIESNSRSTRKTGSSKSAAAAKKADSASGADDLLDVLKRFDDGETNQLSGIPFNSPFRKIDYSTFDYRNDDIYDHPANTDPKYFSARYYAKKTASDPAKLKKINSEINNDNGTLLRNSLITENDVYRAITPGKQIKPSVIALINSGKEKADRKKNTQRAEFTAFLADDKSAPVRHRGDGINGFGYTKEYNPLDYMDNNELMNYYYLMGQNERNAGEYLAYLQPKLSDRAAKESQRKGAEQLGKEHPVISAIPRPLLAASSTVQGIGNLISDITGNEKNINASTTSAARARSGIYDGIDEAVSSGAGNVFLKALHGFADNIPEMAVRTIPGAGKVMSPVVGGGQFLADTYSRYIDNEIIGKPGTTVNAIVNGSIGALTWGFMGKGTGKVLGKVLPGADSAGKIMLRGILGKAFTGAGVGVTQYALDRMSNSVFLGENSDFNRMKKAYISQGLSEDDASEKAWNDTLSGAFSAGLVGAVTSASMGLPSDLANGFSLAPRGRAIRSSEGFDLDTFLKAADAFGDDSPSAKNARKLRAMKGPIKDSQIGAQDVLLRIDAYNEARYADRVSDLTGTKIEVAPLDDPDANAEINGDTIRISDTASEPLRELLKHEAAHRVQDIAPDRFGEYIDAQRGDAFDNAVKQTRALYESKRRTASNTVIEGEAAADMARNFVKNTKDLDRIQRLAAGDVSMLDRMHNALADFRAKVRTLIGKKFVDNVTGNTYTYDELRQYEKLYENAYAEAVRNKADTGAEDVRNSIKEEHTPEQLKIMREYDDAVDENLIKYIDAVKERPSTWYYRISKIPDRAVQEIKDKLNIDVSGSYNTIDKSAITHIEKGHGKNGTKDSSMSDVRDIARIGYVLDNYDTMTVSDRKDNRFRNKDNSFAAKVVFEKRIDGSYYVVEAVPDTGRLAVVTAYKNKASKEPDVFMKDPGQTSYNALSNYASDTTISHRSGDVNGVDENILYSLRRDKTESDIDFSEPAKKYTADDVRQADEDKYGLDIEAVFRTSLIGSLFEGEVKQYAGVVRRYIDLFADGDYTTDRAADLLQDEINKIFKSDSQYLEDKTELYERIHDAISKGFYQINNSRAKDAEFIISRETIFGRAGSDKETKAKAVLEECNARGAAFKHFEQRTGNVYEVSKTYRNTLQNPAFDGARGWLNNSEADFARLKQSNSQQYSEALEQINRETPAGALKALINKAEWDGVETIKAQILISMFGNRGDAESYSAIALELNRRNSRSGRQLQANMVAKKMNPYGRVEAFESVHDKFIAAQISEKFRDPGQAERVKDTVETAKKADAADEVRADEALTEKFPEHRTLKKKRTAIMEEIKEVNEQEDAAKKERQEIKDKLREIDRRIAEGVRNSHVNKQHSKAEIHSRQTDIGVRFFRKNGLNDDQIQYILKAVPPAYRESGWAPTVLDALDYDDAGNVRIDDVDEIFRSRSDMNTEPETGTASSDADTHTEPQPDIAKSDSDTSSEQEPDIRQNDADTLPHPEPDTGWNDVDTSETLLPEEIKALQERERALDNECVAYDQKRRALIASLNEIKSGLTYHIKGYLVNEETGEVAVNDGSSSEYAKLKELGVSGKKLKTHLDKVYEALGIDHVKSAELSRFKELMQIVNEADSAEFLIDRILEISRTRRTAVQFLDRIKPIGDGTFHKGQLKRSLMKAYENFMPNEKNGEVKLDILKSIANQQIFGMLDDSVKRSFGDKANTFRYSMQLSAGTTWIRNILSELFNMHGITTGIASGADKVIELFTKKRTAPTAKFSPKRRVGEIRAGRKRANLAFLESAFNVKLIDQDVNRLGKIDRNRSFKGGAGAALERGLGYNLAVSDEFLKGKFAEHTMRQLENTDAFTAEEKRQLAEDEAMYRTFQNDSLLAKGLDKLKNALNTFSIKGFGLGDFITPYTHVPGNVVTRAIEYSPLGYAKAIYEFGQFAASGRKAAQEWAADQAAAGKDYSGAEFNKYARTHTSAANQRKFVFTLARAMTGTGLIFAAYGLRKLGIIVGKSNSGSYSENEYEKSKGLGDYYINLSALERIIYGKQDGAAPHNGDFTIDIGWMVPINTSLAIGSALHDKVSDNGAEMSAWDTFGQFFKLGSDYSLEQFGDLSVYSSVYSAINNWKHTDGLAEFTTAEAADLILSFMPSLVNQAGNAHDMYSRDPYKADSLPELFLNKLKSKIPIVREGLPLRIDIFGEAQLGTTGNRSLDLFSDMMSPSHIGRYRSNPLTPEIDRLLKQSDDILPKTPYREQEFTLDGKKYKFKLNGHDYEEYANILGQISYKSMYEFMTSEDYKYLSDEDRINKLSEISRQCSYTARDMWVARQTGSKGEFEIEDMAEELIKSYRGAASGILTSHMAADYVQRDDVQVQDVISVGYYVPWGEGEKEQKAAKYREFISKIKNGRFYDSDTKTYSSSWSKEKRDETIESYNKKIKGLDKGKYYSIEGKFSELSDEDKALILDRIDRYPEQVTLPDEIKNNKPDMSGDAPAAIDITKPQPDPMHNHRNTNDRLWYTDLGFRTEDYTSPYSDKDGEADNKDADAAEEDNGGGSGKRNRYRKSYRNRYGYGRRGGRYSRSVIAPIRGNKSQNRVGKIGGPFLNPFDYPFDYRESPFTNPYLVDRRIKPIKGDKA